jgi:hypothetical protein
VTPGTRPREGGIDETASGVRCGPRDPVKVEVRIPLSLAPDRRVVVRHREHTRQRIAVDHAKQPARFDLGADQIVREDRPDARALCMLDRAPLGVRRMNGWEVC